MSKRNTEDHFPPEVVQKLKCYVCRLIDPRNGETFYIGKGRGNRVFSHARDEAGLKGGKSSNKLKRIRAIRNSGFDVAYVIHRHGLDEVFADEIEAALMEAYPGLTNMAGGTGSSKRGVMHAKTIIQRYSAEEAVFHHKVLLININKSIV